MKSGRGEEFEVVSGSPLALALTAARAAAERRDTAGMSAAYRRAVESARRSPTGLRRVIAIEHVSRLRVLGDTAGALACCAEYLADYRDDATLLLLRAETRLQRNDHTHLDTDLDAVRRITGGRPAGKTADASLSRLEGLAASYRGRFRLAGQHLRRARELYAELGDATAVAIVGDDLRLVMARQGTPSIEPSNSAERSPHARLTRAEELRVVGRYEEALAVLEPALADPLDPAQRFFFLEARLRLLRLLRSDVDEVAVMQELCDAAEETARPDQNLVAAQRLARDGVARPEILATGDHELLHIRSLIRSNQLTEAEDLLPAAEYASDESDERHTAEWNLAMSEFLYAVAHHADDPAIARQAVAHAELCLRHAAADSAVAIRVSALRLLGHAHAHRRLDDMEQAVKAWAEAHRLEEEVAARQPTDDVRLRMLHAVPTEFDEQILWACDDVGGAHATAPILIAMEAARGAQILPQIQPDAPRTLPAPGDVRGARRWIRRAVRGMPRSQVVWMLHATQDDIHHALVERTRWGLRLHHQSRSCDRHRLIAAIDAMAKCWKGRGARRLAVARPGTTEFDRRLAEVARLLDLPAFLRLPEHVTRIAVVAGGELSDIPFALLPWPGADGALLGRRYALSTLPCLALRTPLHRRSRGQRGTRGQQMLVLRGPGDEDQPITPAAEVAGRVVLDGGKATATRLRDELSTGKYRQVRIDSHGSYGGDPSKAVLYLAPAGEAGWLRPDQFQDMGFSATGTVALGACETGMGKRIGRDEQTGFVRSALASGASAVLAARWEALDDVAARVLDRFEELLDRYPRDVALFLAQREADTADGHPTRWAALNLYGATGHQTHHGPLVRWFRRLRRNAAEPPTSETRLVSTTGPIPGFEPTTAARTVSAAEPAPPPGPAPRTRPTPTSGEQR